MRARRRLGGWMMRGGTVLQQRGCTLNEVWTRDGVTNMNNGAVLNEQACVVRVNEQTIFFLITLNKIRQEKSSLTKTARKVRFPVF